MKVHLIGLGSVGKSLVELVAEKKTLLKAHKHALEIVAVSDSKGSAIDRRGLDPEEILRFKRFDWRGCPKYCKGYGALRALEDVQSDVVVEITPSTLDGEPGLSNIRAAFETGKHVVTANKGPLVVAFRELVDTAVAHKVKFLYEATVAANLPVFCLVESCFKADELEGIRGVLNATTNYIIEQMEKGKNFQKALEKAIKDGWAETNYEDDINGVDAARKTVILADAFFNAEARLEDVQIKGIRNVANLIREAKKQSMKVKLVCEIEETDHKLRMTVEPKKVFLGDQLANVNEGNMGIVFCFKTSREVFVSAQFMGPKQTAQTVLNDLMKIDTEAAC